MQSTRSRRTRAKEPALPRSAFPPSSQPRRREYKLRLNDDEADLFEQHVALAKRRPAEYLRLLVLGHIDPRAEGPREAASA
jgi:hypothetical protein